MWYRSVKTNKIIYRTAERIVDNILGDGSFEALVDDEILVPVENPTVIDVLRDTGSTKLAAVRYQQIHSCSIEDAKLGVKRLTKDMGRNNRKKRSPNK